jgi:DNA-binding XRE family transcriptional regulator
LTDDTRNGSSTVAPYQRWFDGYGNPIDPPDHTAEWLADNIRLRQENAELQDRIMQTAMENARAIMESETVKMLQGEIDRLRSTSLSGIELAEIAVTLQNYKQLQLDLTASQQEIRSLRQSNEALKSNDAIHMLDRVVAERQKLGLSQAGLGRKAGINQSTMNLLERGRRPLYPGYRKKIAEALGLPEEILFDSGNTTV